VPIDHGAGRREWLARRLRIRLQRRTKPERLGNSQATRPEFDAEFDAELDAELHPEFYSELYSEFYSKL
jgi:hypothetical protein